MHQPFTRSYYEGYDLGRFRRVWDDHFCGEEGEGMVMDISLVFRYFRRTRFRPLPCVSPLANKRSNGYSR